MAKRLLSNDYDNFIIGSFTLPENDFYNYYHNIIDENYDLNPDIFEKLSEAIENRIEWYRTKVYDPYTKEDAEEDENGNRIRLINRDEIGYSLLRDHKINRHIDKSFFDLQIIAINKIELEYTLTKIGNIKKQISTQFHKKTITFDDLFRDKDNARKVKEIFESHGYTINGKWHGLTNDKSELLCAYYVLVPLLKPHKKTPVAKIFYAEFGLSGNYISDRMLTNEPFNDVRKDFEVLFSDLLKSINKK